MQFILIAAVAGILALGNVQPQKQVILTGVIERAVAIGGETTGWRIKLVPLLKEQYGEDAIDVDPGGIELRPFAGKLVHARGKLVFRDTLERGRHRVLELRKIKAVKNSKKKE